MNTQTISLPLAIRQEIKRHMKAKPQATWSLIRTELPHKDEYNFPDSGIRLSLRWTLFVLPSEYDLNVSVATFCEWEPLEDATYTHSRESLAAQRTSTIAMTRQNARASWAQEVGEGGNNITGQIERLKTE